ncbi:MAG TPA: Zn-ribbon domain-containing OB-fold protein [Pseudonocardiaceae bacterium]|jgi:hypothetical protein
MTADVTTPDVPLRPMRPVDVDTQAFWQYIDKSVLAFQRCANCGRLRFYPQQRCPHCGGQDYAWTPTSGRATVRTWSVIHNASDPWFRAHLPYVVAVVEIEDDHRLRMLANIVNCEPDEVHLGQHLRVVFQPVDENRKMYAFEPAD